MPGLMLLTGAGLRSPIRTHGHPHAELLLELALSRRESHGCALAGLRRLLGLGVRAAPQKAEDAAAGLPVLGLGGCRGLLSWHRQEAIAGLPKTSNRLVALLFRHKLPVREGLGHGSGRRSIS